MFKNRESPISLFSFQDIVTSLTGIMLFFLLILVLRIMEITKREEERSPYRAELAEWRKQNELLLKQQQEAAADIANYRKRIREVRKKDRPSLAILKFQLERRIRELVRETDALQKQKVLHEEEKYREERRHEQLAEKQLQIKETARAAERLAQRNRSARERAEQLKSEIRKRRRTVNITVSGETSKKPLVIECSGDCIRIVDPSSKNATVIRRGGGFFTGMANAAAAGLKKYPISEYYFVLLIKPSAANYALYLSGIMQKAYPGAEFGSEPILESEACD